MFVLCGINCGGWIITYGPTSDRADLLAAYETSWPIGVQRTVVVALAEGMHIDHSTRRVIRVTQRALDEQLHYRFPRWFAERCPARAAAARAAVESAHRRSTVPDPLPARAPAPLRSPPSWRERVYTPAIDGEETHAERCCGAPMSKNYLAPALGAPCVPVLTCSVSDHCDACGARSPSEGADHCGVCLAELAQASGKGAPR